MNPPTFRIAAAMAAAFLCLPVSAEWISYQRQADVDELFDPAFVGREQSRIRLWTLTNYRMPMTSLEAKQYSSEKVLTTIDCASRKSGAEQVIRYSGRNAEGEMVGAMDTPLRLTPVRPGSSDEALLDSLCR